MKLVFKSLLRILLILFISINVFAVDYRFKTLTVNSGLSQDDVSCIIQDSFGFIWIGTYDGLNRFDGLRVQNFLSKTDDEESLSSNRILCLYEDSKKRIWIGTDGSGLNYYSLKTEKFVRIKTPNRFKKINHITENEEGEILVATGNGLLKINDGDTPTTEIVQLAISGLNVFAILPTLKNTIYFATNRGIWVLKNKSCYQLEACGNGRFNSLVEDNTNKIWAGGYGMLKVIESGQGSPKVKDLEAFSDISIRTICNSTNGTIWLGTLGHGLLEIDAGNLTILNQITSDNYGERSLFNNTVLSLFLDRANTLWVGNRQGLCYTSLSQKQFKSLPLASLDQSLRRAHIRSLYIDNADILIGTQNKECYHYSLTTKELEPLRITENINALNMAKINDKIYISTNDGIYEQESNSMSFSKKVIQTQHGPLELASVYSLCSNGKGTFFYGTYTGLVVQQQNDAFWVHDKFQQADILQGKRVFSLYYDKSNNCVWIGTMSEGLYKLNLTDKGDLLSLESYNKAMGNDYHIANNTIWCYHKDAQGTLWIGTDAGLLMKARSSNKFIQVKVAGVLDKKIMAIQEDKNGNLWLSNSQGLIWFSPKNNESKRYTYNDGLNASIFTEASGKTEDGILFFGSKNGINYFNPEEIKDNPYKANIAFSDFRVHNTRILPETTYFGGKILDNSINLTTDIVLNYRQNNFIFEFAGTNYANASDNRFKYKLEGYDDDWIYTTGTHRFAPYSNLKPGTYTFLADAANHDGLWSHNPKKINIEVLPPPWLSVWAYLIYTIVIATLIYAFIYFLRNRQKLEHQIELDIVQRKKDKEINELKLMFFTDVAHEFKTPLSLIIGPLNDLMKTTLSREQRDFCYHIVSRNTKRMMFLVNQLLDFRKINADINILKIAENDLADFTCKTTKAFLWQAKNAGIHFNVVTPESYHCFFDKDIIEKVLYNLLSNAFKYTPKNGVVEIEVKPIWEKHRQIANIIIRDSGKGIPDNTKNRIFERYFHGNDRSSSGIGLHLSYKLIKAHKGKINVADSYYGGTEFIITIPVSGNAYDANEFFEHAGPKSQFEHTLEEMDVQEIACAEEREHILIVEDDHDLRAYLKNCLQSQYTIHEAENGIGGIEQATRHLPDIIITDVMMPEMDGIEMCRQLKSLNQTSHIPILILTAKSAEEHKTIGLKAGAWDYISKPFDTQSLHQKIDNIIETRNNFKEFLKEQNISIEIRKHYTPFDQKLIATATKVIEENMSNVNFSAEDFAAELGFSRMQLHRKLKTLVGQSTTSFINTVKICYATKMFDQGCDRIQEAMDAIGINSYSHFNNTFKKIIGMTASQYIAEKRGYEISTSQ